MQVIKGSTKRPDGSPSTASTMSSEGNALRADPVEDFKNLVVQRNPGDIYVYHVGHLAADIASSPALANIQMMTRGLQLMGRVRLMQKRIRIPSVVPETGEHFFVHKTEYMLQVLPGQRINIKDFDTARKAHLDDMRI